MLRVITHPYLNIAVKQFILRDDSHCIIVEGGLAGPIEQYTPMMKDRKTILLSTHGHWDHIGMNASLREAGVPLYAHPGDLPYYENYTWHWQVLFGQFEKDVEVPQARRETVRDRIGRPSSIDQGIQEGDILSFGSYSFRVLHTPGHSWGSVCYLEENEGLLFTGDSLMGNGFFTGAPQYCDVKSYIASMKRLMDVEAKVVYPAHGDPLDGDGLRRRAREGIECALRIHESTEAYLKTAGESACLGDAVKYVAVQEKKAPGAGLCVTVLAHLREIHTPQADRILSCYQSGI